jgi:hypothetical protein
MTNDNIIWFDISTTQASVPLIVNDLETMLSEAAAEVPGDAIGCPMQLIIAATNIDEMDPHDYPYTSRAVPLLPSRASNRSQLSQRRAPPRAGHIYVWTVSTAGMYLQAITAIGEGKATLATN